MFGLITKKNLRKILEEIYEDYPTDDVAGTDMDFRYGVAYTVNRICCHFQIVRSAERE